MTDTAMIGDIPKMRLILARQRRFADWRDRRTWPTPSPFWPRRADYITGETLRVNGGQMML
jgi:hypothetical protein